MRWGEVMSLHTLASILNEAGNWNKETDSKLSEAELPTTITPSAIQMAPPLLMDSKEYPCSLIFPCSAGHVPTHWSYSDTLLQLTHTEWLIARHLKTLHQNLHVAAWALERIFSLKELGLSRLVRICHLSCFLLLKMDLFARVKSTFLHKSVHSQQLWN